MNPTKPAPKKSHGVPPFPPSGADRPRARRHPRPPVLLGALTAAGLLGAAGSALVSAAASPAGVRGEVTPRYVGDSLVLPDGIEQWVLAGASLGLAYDAPAGVDASGATGRMFHNVYIEPTAYRHYVRTGRFREGTMLALALYPAEGSAHPRRDGLYEGDRMAVELALKDTGRYPGGWAYFGFGAGAPGARAIAFPARTCQSCHAVSAADDNVFVQFYPTLRQVRARSD
jgi:hypothetical protein